MIAGMVIANVSMSHLLICLAVYVRGHDGIRQNMPFSIVPVPFSGLPRYPRIPSFTRRDLPTS